MFVVPNAPRAKQIELFSAVLDDIEADPELINKALDVDYDDRGGIVVKPETTKFALCEELGISLVACPRRR